MRLRNRIVAVATGLFGLVTSPLAASEPALRNHREILESLAVATAVPASQPGILAVYTGARDALPKLGEVEEYNAAMAMALNRLSGVFCDALLKADAGKAAGDRRAHRNVDFESGPEELQAETRKEVAVEYARLFFQREPKDREIAILTQVMDAIGEAAPATPEGTRHVLLGACTAAASSFGFLVI